MSALMFIPAVMCLLGAYLFAEMLWHDLARGMLQWHDPHYALGAVIGLLFLASAGLCAYAAFGGLAR
jgi:hypothetical protein